MAHTLAHTHTNRPPPSKTEELDVPLLLHRGYHKSRELESFRNGVINRYLV